VGLPFLMGTTPIPVELNLFSKIDHFRTIRRDGKHVFHENCAQMVEVECETSDSRRCDQCARLGKRVRETIKEFQKTKACVQGENWKATYTLLSSALRHERDVAFRTKLRNQNMCNRLLKKKLETMFRPQSSANKNTSDQLTDLFNELADDENLKKHIRRMIDGNCAPDANHVQKNTLSNTDVAVKDSELESSLREQSKDHAISQVVDFISYQIQNYQKTLCSGV
jgi:hypothetical protein